MKRGQRNVLSEPHHFLPGTISEPPQPFKIGSALKGQSGGGNPKQKLAAGAEHLLPGALGHFLPPRPPGRWTGGERLPEKDRGGKLLPLQQDAGGGRASPGGRGAGEGAWAPAPSGAGDQRIPGAGRGARGAGRGVAAHGPRREPPRPSLAEPQCGGRVRGVAGRGDRPEPPLLLGCTRKEDPLAEGGQSRGAAGRRSE